MQAEKRGNTDSSAAIENTPTAENSDEGLSIEDLALPRAVIARVSKRVLPPNAQIQRQALQAISKSATAFVNYVSSHANENAARANKKTIRPEDVIEAAKELEFGAFVPQLQAALQGYNDSQSEKLKQRRSKALQPEGASTGLQKGEPTVAQTNVGSKGKARDDSQPVMKRARRSSADGINTGTSSDDEESPSEEDERKGQDEEDEQLDDEEEEGEEGVEDVSASSERSEDEKDRLQEDPMEEKNNEDDGNRDEVLDGHESD